MAATQNKIVLITGATGGIGRATAKLLATYGNYQLALHFHTASIDDRQKLSNEIIELSAGNGTEAHLFGADLSSYDGIRKLYADVMQAYKRIDIVFLNAGSTLGVSGVGSLADVPIDVFEQSWKINAGGPILLAQLVLPAMEEAGWGRIIFKSSIAALTGGVVGPHYASSKSALHGFVFWLATKTASKGVTVNAIAPALIGNTKMLPGDEAGLSKTIPVGRFGQAEEIAETVLWLIKTGYVTKKIIPVDGGLVSH